MKKPFKTQFAENIFNAKYSGGMTWKEKSNALVQEVCSGIMQYDDCKELAQHIADMKFIPGGRYLYYAGKEMNFYNNCFCLGAEEDTREEWARIIHDTMSCLMVGGGVGVDYSTFRPEGSFLRRTGGTASGPIPLMKTLNEVGRNVMQGGSRRSALFASLRWNHKDIDKFIYVKDWSNEVKRLKAADFNFPADLDMTNISVNYGDDFLDAVKYDSFSRDIFDKNIKQMLKTAEPGMCFNFGKNSKDTLRNACAEFTSEDDSDVCNLGSINLGNIDNIFDLRRVTYLASQFLVCGGYRADLPYDKVVAVREKNRKIGLGLMGVHEWLLKKGYRYEMNDELHEWCGAWAFTSEVGANAISGKLGINMPKKYRAIAPTGTIGIIASTTTGIEPLYAVAYKRRYLEGRDVYKFEYVIDATAQTLIEQHGLNPDDIETASSLAQDPERRIKFQADMQDYVDMGISSTLNLPSYNEQEFTVQEFSDIVLKYAPRLRGITVYPDGSRGGQPLTAVSYDLAKQHPGMVYDETEEKCAGGICGL